ncbi:hypothetical protein GCM10009676_00490 [Prauserella halophila]|uniref:AAA domain-containing protein n=1 Tax=Prauserella halophila TaxID=185641 RepID=A0ABN1VU36_9PSEU|nr:hypothetical protein [Prauserella halophila]MCP2234607.1 AAA domain-containing protein [Prauserella halophila]
MIGYGNEGPVDWDTETGEVVYLADRDHAEGVAVDPWADVPPHEEPPGEASQHPANEQGAAAGRTHGGPSTAPAAEPSAWRPVDLGPYLRGEITRPEPAVGIVRDDGLRTLYPGKEHTVIGEMESGKSWYALACAAAELQADQVVVYVHFEESDPSDTVERLQALHVDDRAILDRFRFVAPERAITEADRAELLALSPALVILDGINEGMALHGAEIREEGGVAAFRRRLITPFTTAGAAVLGCDHVVKDREARGRTALGSIHKGNALSGSLLVLENAEPFGRGRRGVSHVFVTKDRPGHLRRHGKATRTPGRTYLGTLIVDDEREWKDFLDLAFVAPPEDGQQAAETDPHAELDAHVLAVVTEITAAGQQATQNKVRVTAGGNRQAACDALERLAIAGHLTESTGSRGARVFVPTCSGAHTSHPGSATCSCPGPKGPGTREQDAHLFPEQDGTSGNKTQGPTG